MIELPSPAVIEWCRAVVAAADAARAEREEPEPAPNNLSGSSPVEVCEADMATMLDITPSALQKRRNRGACEGLYRRSGHSIYYSVPLTLAAFRIIEPDILE